MGSRELTQPSAQVVRIAPLSPPFESQPGEIAQLDCPGDGVGGNAELVVENSCLFHLSSLFPLSKNSPAESGAQGLLRFVFGDLLLLALDAIAKAQDEQAPGQPGEYIPFPGSQH